MVKGGNLCKSLEDRVRPASVLQRPVCEWSELRTRRAFLARTTFSAKTGGAKPTHLWLIQTQGMRDFVQQRFGHLAPQGGSRQGYTLVRTTIDDDEVQGRDAQPHCRR